MSNPFDLSKHVLLSITLGNDWLIGSQDWILSSKGTEKQWQPQFTHTPILKKKANRLKRDVK